MKAEAMGVDRISQTADHRPNRNTNARKTHGVKKWHCQNRQRDEQNLEPERHRGTIALGQPGF